MNALLKLVDRVFAGVGAVVFMQAPQFIQNYTHVLYGHLAELHWELDQMHTFVHKSGKTIEALAKKFLSSSDPDIIFQGELIEKLVTRERDFSLALQALTTANPLTKPFVFLRHADKDLIGETWVHFKLGLPITVEALGWGFFGLLAGYFLFRLLYALARSLGRIFSQ